MSHFDIKDYLDVKFDALESRLDHLETKMDTHDAQTAEVVAKVAYIKGVMTILIIVGGAVSAKAFGLI